MDLIGKLKGVLKGVAENIRPASSVQRSEQAPRIKILSRSDTEGQGSQIATNGSYLIHIGQQHVQTDDARTIPLQRVDGLNIKGMRKPTVCPYCRSKNMISASDGSNGRWKCGKCGGKFG